MKQDINQKPFDEKTLLKLDIFQECFKEWLPVFIHNSFIDEIYVLDLFSGSGTDTEGNYGSPLLLMDVVGKNGYNYCQTNLDKLSFWFNDKQNDKIQSLKSEIENYCKLCNSRSKCDLKCPLLNHIKYTSSDFNSLFYGHPLKTILGSSRIGVFMLIDQYGIKSFDQNIFVNLLNAKYTDFICFYPSSFVRRFREHDAINKYIETNKIDFINATPPQTHRVIANYYKSLIPNGKEYFIHHFSYLKGSNYYGLIFGSSHSYGMEKFLKICWQYDPYSGESTENINGDYHPGELFYEGESKTIKKENVKKELLRKIRESKITNNKQGLKETLRLGCEPSLFKNIIKELSRGNRIEIISGEYNEQATSIHKVKEFNFKYLR